METFIINEDLLNALDEYHDRSMLMEKHIIESLPFNGDLKSVINDDLIFNVPIYDMGQRKYAAFCSFTEAVWKKEKDIKGNGNYFSNHEIKNEFDWFMLFYLFRLCGSGINYKPKVISFHGSHGFGNFWIVNSIINGKYTYEEWIKDLLNLKTPFTDNKGYLLPQFSFNGLKNNHLKKFIIDYSYDLIMFIYNKVIIEKKEIYQITDLGNYWLKLNGFKAQNFVLTAFAADLAEYFPKYVDRFSRVYAGTNATKCIKTIFPKNNRKISEFDYINSVLDFQSKRYGLTLIDCEDSRNCDPVRYFQEYQSKEHIFKNNGKIMFNNCILKQKWGIEKYYKFSKNLK